MFPGGYRPTCAASATQHDVEVAQVEAAAVAEQVVDDRGLVVGEQVAQTEAVHDVAEDVLGLRLECREAVGAARELDIDAGLVGRVVGELLAQQREGLVRRRPVGLGLADLLVQRDGDLLGLHERDGVLESFDPDVERFELGGDFLVSAHALSFPLTVWFSLLASLVPILKGTELTIT